jgi:uncharacterized membrane protein YphA (DoxX/SURF4 family)
MNPFIDSLHFLMGDTGDFNRIGVAKYLLVSFLWLLLLTGFVVATINWREDPAQRNGRTVTLWIIRVLIGCMWFEGSLWKLPFGVDNGLHFWTEQMAGRAAFQDYRDFVANVMLPNFAILNPIVYLAELGFAGSLITGLFVRLSAFGATLMTLSLWLGIYLNRGSDPAEWAWTYVFLAMLHVLFIAFTAGRALGSDAFLRRRFGAKGLVGFLT